MRDRRDARKEVLAKGVELPPPLQRGDSIGCGQLFAVMEQDTSPQRKGVQQAIVAGRMPRGQHWRRSIVLA